MSIKPTNNFYQLPEELLHHILRFLSVPEVLKCERICQLFKKAISSDFLWKHFCERDFSTQLNINLSWRTLYEQKYSTFSHLSKNPKRQTRQYLMVKDSPW